MLSVSVSYCVTVLVSVNLLFIAEPEPGTVALAHWQVVSQRQSGTGKLS